MLSIDLSSPVDSRRPPGNGVCAALLVLALCLTGAASAQELGEESRGFRYDDRANQGFYSVETIPPGIRLELSGRNRLIGPSPLSIPADIQGVYRLQATGPGYETQRARLVLPGGGQPVELAGPHDVGLATLSLALLWPGTAELRQGSQLRGRGWAIAGAVGAVATLVNHLGLQDELDYAAEARQALNQTTGGSARQLAMVEVVRHEAKATRSRAARRDWALFTGAIWGLSLVDHFLLTPGLDRAEIGLTEVTIELQPLSRVEAGWRSLLTPGMGQLYAGRPRAAALAMFGTLTAGVTLLATEHYYDEAVNRVAAIEQLYNEPQADPETLATLRPTLADEVQTADSRRTTRNVLLGVTAGAWALSIVDAYLGTPVATRERPFRYSLRPAIELHPGGQVAATWALNF